MYGARAHLVSSCQLWLLAGLLLSATGCTTQASWRGEGTVGEACFPDNTCDPGLSCINGRCQSQQVVTKDAQVADLSGQEAASPPVDGAPCAAPLPQPVLRPLPPTTAYDSYPIVGEAPEAQEVIISGGAQDRRVPVQGDMFCADIPLNTNTINKLQVVAINEAGCQSEPTLAQIQQQQPLRVNQLLGKEAWSSDEPKSGSLLELTDGMTSGIVKFWFYDPTPMCDQHVALAFNLKKSTVVDQVVVRYPDTADFSHYLTCWALLASDEEAPPLPPNKNTPGWRVLAESQEEIGGTLKIPLGGEKVRQLALLMYQNGSVGMWENFDLTEIEAWGTTNLGDPPRCN